MSFRVIVKGTSPARLIDIECHNCGLLIEDIWKDQIDPECPECKTVSMLEVFRRAPMVDFRNTKPIRIPGLKQTFTSHREMESWAKVNDKTVIPSAREYEMLPVDTPEERIDKANGPKRHEAVKKAMYSLRHPKASGTVAKETP